MVVEEVAVDVAEDAEGLVEEEAAAVAARTGIVGETAVVVAAIIRDAKMGRIPGRKDKKEEIPMLHATGSGGDPSEETMTGNQMGPLLHPATNRQSKITD